MWKIREEENFVHAHAYEYIYIYCRQSRFLTPHGRSTTEKIGEWLERSRENSYGFNDIVVVALTTTIATT